IAQRCLYGVDKNPLAADLAKLSLWLATLAKDHPFTFLDHSLRAGDSLVGLTRRQIAAFDWSPDATGFPVQVLEKRIRLAAEYRQRILAAADDVPYVQLLQQLNSADDALSLPREVGDAVVSVFFSEANAAARERCRKGMRVRVEQILRGAVTETLPAAPAGVLPFHWELEFPEVFSGGSGGFDAIVGNPPFMGGSKLSSAAGTFYTSWLSALHPGSRGKSDLVAHFFRRAFSLLRDQGTFGLIATNTVRQGDTRETGLLWIRNNGGTIYRAETRKRWPGTAAVVVSVVHVMKSPGYDEPPILDGKSVEVITAFLFHMGPDGSPSTLTANHPLVHSGTNINGKGFVLTPELRDALIAQCPACCDRIRPYLGAEEMNETPNAGSTRFVIYLEGLDEDQAKAYPALYRHLYETVRLQRQGSSEPRLKERWWLYSRPASELYKSCAGMQRILASGRAGAHLCFVFQPTSTVFSDALTCFIFDRCYGFTVLQSRVHEVWARFFGSSLKDDLRYIPEDCFETFPFPRDFERDALLERVGCTYYDFRAQLMQRENKGLTAIYNWFHDPECECPDIPKLRELHDAMDRAVLDAYSWTDIRPHCEFITEFDDEEDEDENGRPRRKKYRYRWPDDIRDEVLARLLELNRQRAIEEGQLLPGEPILTTAGDPPPARKRSGKTKEKV
ncbi:MAG: Eco57I restriction-modification methylase domain-containing protein, partial [bacterium]